MMSTGSIGATRKSASHTNLPPMQTGKVSLPRSQICLPSAWYTVPSYFCSGTGYCSAVSLDMKYTPLPVSTTALLSAQPISAFTSIDGPLLSRTDVAFEDQGRSGQKRVTHCWPEQSCLEYVLAPADPRLTAPSYLGSFENSALSHGTHSTHCLDLPFRYFLVAEVLLPGNHSS